MTCARAADVVVSLMQTKLPFGNNACAGGSADGVTLAVSGQCNGDGTASATIYPNTESCSGQGEPYNNFQTNVCNGPLSDNGVSFWTMVSGC